MAEENNPLGLISIPGLGPIQVLPGIPGKAAEIAEREGLGAIPGAGLEATAKAFDQFKVGILGIGGLMGFALFLFLLGRGLSALGIDLQDEEEE